MFPTIAGAVNSWNRRTADTDASMYRALLSRLGQPAVDALMSGSAGVYHVWEVTVDGITETMRGKERLDKPQEQKEAGR
jgi:hypothetical protein